MQGRRVKPKADGTLTFDDVQPGDYWLREIEGVRHWYAVAPSGQHCNLSAHDVVEHQDETITVSPSIAVKSYVGDTVVRYWHGFLRKGVWSEA